MLYPFRIAFQGLRLLPPTVGLEDVHFAVAIHVPVAIAVGEFLPAALRRDFVKGPWLCRIAPVGRRVAQITTRMKNDLWLSITGKVAPGWRLVIHHIEDFVPGPVFGAIRRFFALGIFVPGGVQARKTVNDNVIPAVFV